MEHLLVKRNFDILKMHGTTIKRNDIFYSITFFPGTVHNMGKYGKAGQATDDNNSAHTL
jgi:hypothetical protein